MTLELYELNSCDAGGLYFIPDSLYYFQDHFVCEPMAALWEPPPFKAIRKRAKPTDFVSWMLRAPVVRDRVREILRDYVGDDLEFLPFYETMGGEQLFAMNVLTTDASRPIFKNGPASKVYVRHEFGVLAATHKFTGIALADPGANNGRLVVRGESINVFPGLQSPEQQAPCG